ncbi:DUF6894 family protein [Microvirga zambiensis]|uniref:DUF6894 family protein n=1 Tax=Microvirga zambiensis TaxID=1402137 RepID=UPI003CCD1C76
MQHSYYFHRTNGHGLYPDPMGLVLDRPAARRHALEDARAPLESWMIRSALPWRIEVQDSAGVIVCSVARAETAVSEARPLFYSERNPGGSVSHALEGAG